MSQFERSQIREGNADAVLLFSVLSMPLEESSTLFQEAKDQIALQAVRVLRPGGVLILGWYQQEDAVVESHGRDWVRLEPYLENLRSMGYPFLGKYRRSRVLATSRQELWRSS